MKKGKQVANERVEMIRKHAVRSDVPSPSCKKNIFSPNESIAVYTVLFVLSQMKETLGLEVMLEYADRYIKIVEERHPQLKKALLTSLQSTSIEQLYEKILR